MGIQVADKIADRIQSTVLKDVLVLRGYEISRRSNKCVKNYLVLIVILQDTTNTSPTYIYETLHIKHFLNFNSIFFKQYARFSQ